MSSLGHLLTLISIFFLFLMIGDTIIEKKFYTNIFLGFPRLHKRINYYLFKINYLKNCKTNASKKNSLIPLLSSSTNF